MDFAHLEYGTDFYIITPNGYAKKYFRKVRLTMLGESFDFALPLRKDQKGVLRREEGDLGPVLLKGQKVFVE